MLIKLILSSDKVIARLKTAKYNNRRVKSSDQRDSDIKSHRQSRCSFHCSCTSTRCTQTLPH